MVLDSEWYKVNVKWFRLVISYKDDGKCFRLVIWSIANENWFWLVTLCQWEIVLARDLFGWFDAILRLCVTYLLLVIDVLVCCNRSTWHWVWLTAYVLVVDLLLCPVNVQPCELFIIELLGWANFSTSCSLRRFGWDGK